MRAQARHLKAERPNRATISSAAQRSHNMPPELLETETGIVRAVDLIWDQVDDAAEELEKINPDKSRLRQIGAEMLQGIRAVASYVGGKCDVFLEEAMKSGGKWAGPVAFGALVSPKVIEFIAKLLKFAGAP